MKLIKQNEEWYIISEELPEKLEDLPTHKFLKASSDKSLGLPLIDPKQVEYLLYNKIDVHKQAITYSVSKDYNVSNISVDSDFAHQSYMNGLDMYKEGYNEATKVYKYTDSDVAEIIKIALQKVSNMYGTHSRTPSEVMDKFNSLTSPIKEGVNYEVEIEMEKAILLKAGDGRHGKICPLCNKCYSTGAVKAIHTCLNCEVPKVNKEGFINILKIS